jgi:hypothetical protein
MSAGAGFSAAGTGISSPGMEGWYSRNEGQNSFTAQGYSQGSSQSLAESTSEFSGESESVFSASSDSAVSSQGGSVGRSTAYMRGESTVPVWVPIPVQELGSEAEWGREEKVSKVALMLKTQQQRHCFIKLDKEDTQPLQVPFVREHSVSSPYLIVYEREVYKAQQAITGDEADRLLEANERRFLITAGSSTGTILPSTQTSIGPAEEEPPKKDKRNLFESLNPDDLDDPIGRE